MMDMKLLSVFGIRTARVKIYHYQCHTGEELYL
jgi:hypothetical protein